MNIGLGNLGLQGLTQNRTDKSADAAQFPTPKSAVPAERSNGDFSKILKAKNEPAKKFDSREKIEDEKDTDTLPQDSRYPDRPVAVKTTRAGGQQDNGSVKAKAANEAPLNGSPRKIVEDLDASVVENAWNRKPLGETGALKNLELAEEGEQVQLNPATQEAIMRFLATMKAELGVEPQEIMEAMSRLEVTDLLKAPEDTMAQVLDGLKLGGADRVRAADLYQTMLMETAQASLQNTVRDSGKEVDLKVLTPEQLAQEKMLASLERMNSEFFPRKDLNPETSQMRDPLTGQLTAQNQRNDKDKFEMPAFFAAAGAAGAAAGQKAAAGAPTEALTPPSADPFAQSGLQPVKAEMPEPVAVKPQMKSGESVFNVESLLGGAGAVAAASSADARDAGDGESLEGEAQPQPGQFQVQNSGKAQDMFAPAAAAALQQPLRQGDEAQNVRQVIQGAQLLIQKGGGEMKIQMQPEGMGNVDLKVSVQDGKVDIRMMAENNDTKRLLESGLADLKDNLLSHKLNVETLKIDVNPNKGHSDLEQQFANQQREMARDFLGQFRQQNQAGRQQFLDTTGMKSYGKRGKPMTPADMPIAANRVKDSSRKLDLVA